MKRNLRYDSKSYVDAYHRYGIYPKIHDNLFYLIANTIMDEYVCVDIGSCTGLMSVRLIEEGDMIACTGFEANQKYIDRSIKHDKVSYVNMRISQHTMNEFNDYIKDIQPKLAVCRRIIPELSDLGINVVDSFVDVLADNGVKYIALEGRVPVGKPVNKLHTAKHEINALSRRYSLSSQFKHCAIMELKNE